MDSKQERVIMISGANRGMGLAIAQKLYGEGYKLSLGVRSVSKMNLDWLDDDDDRVLIVRYDARDRKTASNWVEKTVNQFGRIDGVINNAGVMHVVKFEDDREDLLDDMWEVNAKAPLRLLQSAFPYLRKSGHGRVINVISMSGKRVKGMSVGYAMSKFAARAVSHSAQLNGWEDGIRVTALCPGFVNTEMVTGISPIEPENMIQKEDVAQMVSSILQLPNNAVVPELEMNCIMEIQK